MEVIKKDDALKVITQHLDRINGTLSGTMAGVAKVWLAEVPVIEVEQDG